eukprot:8721512-Lingulodinium_polyedra.AAC.1
MQWAQRQGAAKRGLLKFDIKGARRLAKRPRHTWRYLVMKVGEEYFVNTVGAFGEGPAGYWWSRLYAAVH